MLTVNKLIPQARGLAPVLIRRAATVELDWDVRQKSRFDATDSSGRHIGVFLPRGTLVRGGDVLVGEDGSLVMVRAALQPVLMVSQCPDHGTPFDLLRAAYHLGNRHVALELQPDRLQLEPDHVLAEMLRQMHLVVTEGLAPFEPEGGAYALESHGREHAAHAGHAGADHDGHRHDGAAAEHDAPAQPTTPELHQQHDHGHHEIAASDGARRTAAEPSAAAHVHGPGCGHSHSH